MARPPQLKKIALSFFLAAGATLCGIYLIMNSLQENRSLEAERKEAPGKFITLSEGVTHYSLEGPDSAKLIVLITGGGITGLEVWEKNIPSLVARGYRVLAYDLFGRGYSDRPAAAITPEVLARQVTELVDSLHAVRPFDVMAMSFGAIVALDYIKAHPNRVDRLVLLDPTATGEYRISKVLTIPVLSPFIMTVYWHPKAIENQRKEFVDQDLFKSYSVRLQYFMAIKGYKKMTLDTWNYVLNQNRLALLGGFPANKVLLIYGDRDPYFPAGNTPLFQNVYPSLRYTVVPDAGHMPQFEKPAVVNSLITDFLGAPAN